MYKEIGPSSATDIKKYTGKPFEGTYVGKKIIQTKIGQQVIWNFESEDGPLGIYGFTNLNLIMEGVKEGTQLRITYTGTKLLQTKYGKKDVHQVKVEAWEGEDKNELPDFDQTTEADVPF